jgi:hypothetical protein
MVHRVADQDWTASPTVAVDAIYALIELVQP